MSTLKTLSSASLIALSLVGMTLGSAADPRAALHFSPPRASNAYVIPIHRTLYPQDFAIDAANRVAIVQTVILADHSTYRLVVSPLSGDSSRQLVTNPISFIGHQGLSLESSDARGWVLWASSADMARNIVRFRLNRDGTISNIEKFSLFSDDFAPNMSAQPEVCADQKHIAVVGYSTSQSKRVVRTFAIDEVVRPKSPNGAATPRREIVVDPKLTEPMGDKKSPIQGLACSKDSISLVSGGGRYAREPVADTRVQVYSLATGKPVHTDMGYGERHSAMYDHSEPEGLAVAGGKVYLGVVETLRSRKLRQLSIIPLQ